MLERLERPEGQLRVRDALGFGWRALIRHLLLFVGLVVAVRLIYYGLSLAESWLVPRAPWAAAMGFVVHWVIGIALSIAFIRISLKVADGVRPTLMDLRSTPATFFRFALTSLSFTLGFVALIIAAEIAAMAILMIFSDIKSARGHLSLPLSVGISALGAATLFAAFRLGRWLIDRQLYGHLVVDRNLGPKAALRASVELVRTARWQLLGVVSLVFCIGAVVVIAAILTMDLPAIPRAPWQIPHIATGLPPFANAALTQVLGGLAALDGWLLLITLSFVYRTLAGRPSPAILPVWAHDGSNRERTTAVPA